MKTEKLWKSELRKDEETGKRQATDMVSIYILRVISFFTKNSQVSNVTSVRMFRIQNSLNCDITVE